MYIQFIDLVEAYREQIKLQHTEEGPSVTTWNQMMISNIDMLKQKQKYFLETLSYNLSELPKLIQDALNVNFSQKQQPQNYLFKQQNEQGRHENSETISLSLISEQIQQMNIQESPYWLKDFTQYGELFKPLGHLKNFIKTVQFDNILNNNFGMVMYQRFETKLYSGFSITKMDWIVIKEQILPDEQLQNSIQQFIIQDYIYQLYPNKFLQLLQPVYIHKIDGQNNFMFISQFEYGQTNLYDYSQQNQIKDQEYQLIFQQLYQQIQLLHNHNIAHRDIKPQNIVYVENKGWLLCDFEDSQKYQDANGIYDIRGTQAFLQPYLQLLSHIQGISTKQNLYANDIYALAITLIIVKYQIKHQDDINHYINQPDDKIIDSLIKNLNQNNIYQQQIDDQVSFIKIIFQKPLKILTISELDINEIQSFIEILHNQDILKNKFNKELNDKILDLLDQILKQHDENFNFICLLCYLKIPQYVKNLKYISEFNKLRQRKYWRQIYNQFQKLKNRNYQIYQIIFMYELGLTDLTIYYARQFLKIDYDFLVHLIIICILIQDKQIDEANREYNLILQYREFKYMNPQELEKFIIITLNMVQWNQFNEDDIKFFSQITSFQCININPIEFEQNNQNNENSLQIFVQNVMQIFKNQTNKQILLPYALRYIEMVYSSVDVNIVQQFIIKIKQLIKYFCTAFVWQKMLVLQTFIYVEMKNKQMIKKIIKEINYVLVLNSESQIQQRLLKILKLQSQSQQQIRKQQKQKLIEKQVYDVLISLDDNILKNGSNIIEELVSIMAILANDQKKYRYYCKIINYFCLNTQFIQQWHYIQQNIIMNIITFYFLRTLNLKRYCQWVKGGYQTFLLKGLVIKQSSKNDLRLQLQQQQYNALEDQFLLEQYRSRI